MTTHEQRMKAVIEVGERATPQHWSYEDDRDSVVAVSVEGGKGCLAPTR